MDAQGWDERYAARDLVWSAGPNRWVEEIFAEYPPGRVWDVAAGEGRNAIWFAQRGWRALATDFSDVAVQRAQRIAAEYGLGERFEVRVADATQPPDGETGEFDLVLFCYLHLPEEQWLAAVRHAVAACAPGGTVAVIGHSLRNLSEGVGGPQDPAVLRDPEQIAETLSAQGLQVESARMLTRAVQTDDGVRDALDAVVIARQS